MLNKHSNLLLIVIAISLISLNEITSASNEEWVIHRDLYDLKNSCITLSLLSPRKIIYTIYDVNSRLFTKMHRISDDAQGALVNLRELYTHVFISGVSNCAINLFDPFLR